MTGLTGSSWFSQTCSGVELSKNYGHSDQLFGVPLDIHTLVLYYNKTALQKAGLLGSDGKPTGLDGIDAFAKMLTTAKEKTHLIPVSENMYSEDPASLWRLWYTFFKLMGVRMPNGRGNGWIKDVLLVVDAKTLTPREHTPPWRPWYRETFADFVPCAEGTYAPRSVHVDRDTADPFRGAQLAQRAQQRAVVARCTGTGHGVAVANFNTFGRDHTVLRKRQGELP